jgi:hypothetical protein
LEGRVSADLDASVLVALRFFRAILGLMDDFYNRFLLRSGLLQPVVDAFVRNGKRYNLFNSACLEFFEFIRAVSIELYGLHGLTCGRSLVRLVNKTKRKTSRFW